MSRENMFDAAGRETGVTPAMEKDRKQVAEGGKLSCAQAMECERNHTVPLKK